MYMKPRNRLDQCCNYYNLICLVHTHESVHVDLLSQAEPQRGYRMVELMAYPYIN
jgi:hypothetical protein